MKILYTRMWPGSKTAPQQGRSVRGCTGGHFPQTLGGTKGDRQREPAMIYALTLKMYFTNLIHQLKQIFIKTNKIIILRLEILYLEFL